MLFLAVALAVQIGPTTPDIAFRQPQLAATPDKVVVAFGAGSDIYFASSTDHGRSFPAPVRIPSGGKMALGRHRGPRVAIAGSAVVISAPVGQKGGGADGDILAWRSTDGGKTWTGPARVNDEAAVAREGLHAMTAGRDGTLFAAWLDLREGKMALYGAKSTDGGATWGKNVRIYRSPDGHICECCHPSALIAPNGDIYAMWRNWLGGSRDLYLAVSKDGGETFHEQKLGEGTWPLDACPMDGGGVAWDATGKPITTWRRESAVFLAVADAAERELGPGKDPSIAAGKKGAYVAWTNQQGLKLARPGAAAPETLSPEGEFVSLAAADEVFAAWENKGSIYVQALGK